MNKPEERDNIIDKIITWTVIVLFILMFGVTNLNVITRYFFNKPVVIAVELARYCFVALIYIGAIITTKRDKHIALDFFVNYMPIKVRRGLEQFGRIAMILFFSIFCYFATVTVLNNINVKSSSMQISMAIVYLPMVIGSAGIVIESAINVYLFGTGKKVKLSELEEVEKQKEIDKQNEIDKNGGAA